MCGPASRFRTGLTQIIRDLDEWLNSINPDLGKKKLPSVKELWKYIRRPARKDGRVKC